MFSTFKSQVQDVIKFEPIGTIIGSWISSRDTKRLVLRKAKDWHSWYKSDDKRSRGYIYIEYVIYNIYPWQWQWGWYCWCVLAIFIRAHAANWVDRANGSLQLVVARGGLPLLFLCAALQIHILLLPRRVFLQCWCSISSAASIAIALCILGCCGRSNHW